MDRMMMHLNLYEEEIDEEMEMTCAHKLLKVGCRRDTSSL